MSNLTVEHIANHVLGDFMDWQDSDSEDSKGTPIITSYTLIKQAVGLPQETIESMFYLDKLTWIKALSNYTVLRNIGYEHLAAIEELAKIHTRNNL